MRRHLVSIAATTLACLVAVPSVWTASRAQGTPAPLPVPVSSSPDDTKRRVADLEQKGRRYDGERVLLWTPAAFPTDAATQLTGQLDKAVVELRSLIGAHEWQTLKDPSARLTFFVSEEEFISYSNGGAGILLPWSRVKIGKAGFLPLATAALLNRVPVGATTLDPATAQKVQATRSRWLTDGLMEYLGFAAAKASGFRDGDVFDVGGVEAVDRTCAARLSTEARKEVLPFIGGLGSPAALATPERPRVAPAYYACAFSFTKYLVGRVGLGEMIALVDLQSRVRRDTTPISVTPDGTLPRIEALTGESMSAIRDKWLAAIRG